jgi:predicted nucleotidyltransferase
VVHALPAELTVHLDEIRALCERYGMRALYIFGSATQGTFDAESSDFDFVVDAGERDDSFLGRATTFSYHLERLVGRDIDLILSDSIRDQAFAAEVKTTQVLLHAS